MFHLKLLKRLINLLFNISNYLNQRCNNDHFVSLRCSWISDLDALLLVYLKQ